MNILDQSPWQSAQLHPPWPWLTPRPVQKSHIVFLDQDSSQSSVTWNLLSVAPQMGRKVLIGFLARQTKRGREAFFPFFFFYLLLQATSSPRAPSPQTRALTTVTHCCSGWKAKQNHLFLFLTMRPSEWHTYKHLFLQGKEKPNFFCDTCTTPLRLDIFWD